MKKYEEEHYRYEKIKDCIYPWVKEELRDSKALNGKNISEKDTPVIAFAGDLKIIFAIKTGVVFSGFITPLTDNTTTITVITINAIPSFHFFA